MTAALGRLRAAPPVARFWLAVAALNVAGAAYAAVEHRTWDTFTQALVACLCATIATLTTELQAEEQRGRCARYLLTMSEISRAKVGRPHPRPFWPSPPPAAPRGADIEIVERRPARSDAETGTIVPDEIRINGAPVLAPADHPVRVHEINIDAHELVLVTLTLFARRVTIGRAPTDPEPAT